MKREPHYHVIVLLICFLNPVVFASTAESGPFPPKKAVDCKSNCDARAAIPKRTELTKHSLFNSKGFSLTDFRHFSMPNNSSPPKNNFNGVLSLENQAKKGNFELLKDEYEYMKTNSGEIKHLPEFNFEFVQFKNYLIPKNRGANPARHPNWEFILEPGRVWDEVFDGEFSRASIPFTLQEKNENCMHNGVMTFLFKSNGEISKVAYQIASETCKYFQFNMWGILPAKYTSRKVKGSKEVVSSYKTELTNRMPIKPISQLATDYPNADYSQFGSIQETPSHGISTYGFVIDGIHYVGGCNTRYGTYPYCSVISLPSYSTAKTTFAGFALLRLQKKYPGVFNKKISDYIPECESNGQWEDVTIEHAVDMTTGNFISKENMVDEVADHVGDFFAPTTHKGKIEYACNKFSRRINPGTHWVYHTSDTYIAGTALNAFIKEKEGPSADIYQDVIVKDLWTPLKLNPAIKITRRTYDKIRQPHAGYGLTYTTDDIAKIGAFLTSGGKINGVEVFDKVEFKKAMMQDPNDLGFPGGYDKTNYNNSFWGRNVKEDLEGCNEDTWLPIMYGFGGVSIIMMPNNTSYYMVSDSETWRWIKAVKESYNIRAFCGFH